MWPVAQGLAEIYRKYGGQETLRLSGRYLSRPRAFLNMAGLEGCQREQPLFVPYLPVELDIEPTVRCNLRCTTCQQGEWQRRTPDLGLEGFKEILAQFPTLQQIKLSGLGEPLLNKDIFSLVRYATDLGIRVWSFTNGTLLDEERCRQLIASGIAEIRISLDGATPRTYNRIRQGASFKQVVSNIQRLIRCRGKSPQPRIGIHSVAQRQNLPELPLLVELAHRLGVDYLYYQQKLISWGRNWRDKLKEMELSTEAQAKMRQAGRLAQHLGVCLISRKATGFSAKEGQHCPWPWKAAFITAEGHVCPCCILVDPQQINFGNLFQQGFPQIWNNPKYQAFRASIREGRIPELCRECYLE